MNGESGGFRLSPLRLLIGGALLVLALGGFFFLGYRSLQRLELDARDPARRREILEEVTGASTAPEGWTLARAFATGSGRLLLFEGEGGRPPISILANARGGRGLPVTDRWLAPGPDPPPGNAYRLRDARRLSRGELETSAGRVRYAVLEGTEDGERRRRAVFDLRGVLPRFPAEAWVSPESGADVDLAVAGEFLRGLLSGRPGSRPGEGR